MAYVVGGDRQRLYITGMAYMVMACIPTSSIVMAYTVMADMGMALHSYGLYSYGTDARWCQS